MLVGEIPYPSENQFEMMEYIMNSNFGLPDTNCSSDALDLWQKLLVKEPEKRLGANDASEITTHPFFKGINWKRVYNNEIPLPREIMRPMFSNLDTVDENEEETEMKTNNLESHKFEGFTYAGVEVLDVPPSRY